MALLATRAAPVASAEGGHEVELIAPRTTPPDDRGGYFPSFFVLVRARWPACT